jgi:hypothetical protein
VIVYDATILALPLIWIGADIVEHRQPADADRFLTSVYWIFVTFLAPTALAIKLQVSVLLMTWIFARSVLSVLRQTPLHTASPLQLTPAIS